MTTECLALDKKAQTSYFLEGEPRCNVYEKIPMIKVPDCEYKSMECQRFLGEVSAVVNIVKRNESIKVKNLKEKNISEHIDKLIFRKMNFPQAWLEEKISPPNLASKIKAKEVCLHLWNEFGLIPYVITPTKEEGVYIGYEDEGDSGDLDLIIEIYNNLEGAALVNDRTGKKILFSKDIKDTKIDFEKMIQIIKNPT